MEHCMDRLLQEMEAQHLDAFFITNEVNIQYVSHYTSDGAYLLITPGEKFIITDPRYTEQATIDCPNFTVVEWRRKYPTVASALASIYEKVHFKTVGYESGSMTVDDFDEYSKAVPAEWVKFNGVIEEMRSIKTPQEIAYLRASCQIASQAFERIIKDIRVGITEKELAAKLSYYMVMEGADTQPYGNILISGPHSSLLHGIPSNRAIEYGDIVLMDYGCQYHGYLSDMTRTVIVGRSTAKQREVYQLVRDMNEAMEAVMVDGITGDVAYQAGAKLLEGSEYYQYHYNRVGHGIGRFVHEYPFTGPGFEDKIREGTVMTAEPGIYIPGWGGIRIEDQLLILKGGNENLVTATKDLIEL